MSDSNVVLGNFNQMSNSEKALFDEAVSILDKHFSKWAYLSREDKFLNIFTHERISSIAFDRLHGEINFPTHIAETKDGAMFLKMAKRPSDAYTSNHFKRYCKVSATTVSGEHSVGDVIANSNGVDRVNIWNGTAVKPVEHDGAPLFEQLVDTMMEDEDAKNVLQWMAYKVMNPTKKIRWSPVIVGTKGNGKSTLSMIISKIIGMKYQQTLKKAVLKDKFNGWIEGKLIAIVEEIKIGGDFEVMDTLKEYVTNETVSVRGMQKDAVNCENLCDFIFFSNHVDALKVDNDERRWYPVMTCQRCGDDGAVTRDFGPQGGRDFFQSLFDFIDTKEGIEAICHYLHQVDLSDFNKSRAPESVHKEEFVSASLTQNAMLIQELIEEGDIASGGVLLKVELEEIAHEKNVKLPATSRFSNAMLELGYVKYTYRPVYKRLNKRLKTTAYVKRELESSIPDNKAVIDVYKKHAIFDTVQSFIVKG